METRVFIGRLLGISMENDVGALIGWRTSIPHQKPIFHNRIENKRNEKQPVKAYMSGYMIPLYITTIISETNPDSNDIGKALKNASQRMFLTNQKGHTRSKSAWYPCRRLRTTINIIEKKERPMYRAACEHEPCRPKMLWNSQLMCS